MDYCLAWNAASCRTIDKRYKSCLPVDTDCLDLRYESISKDNTFGELDSFIEGHHMILTFSDHFFFFLNFLL